MKTTIEAHIDDVDFGVWDEENDVMLIEAGEIAEFLNKLPTKKANLVLADAMQMFCADLKEQLKKDLVDCWASDD